jgi:DNA-binding response OmpR family regulator
MTTTTAPRKVLIVDDDRDFVEALAAYLESNGLAVCRAYDGRTGVTTALAERPDLILMDIIMGERTEGFFAVQQLRHTPELKAVPIFVMSSLYSAIPGFRVTPERSWLAHDEFFPKPLDLTALLARVRRELGLDEAAGTAARAGGGA